MKNFFYCFKEGIKGFQRAKLSSILTIVTFAVSIFMIGSFLILTLNLQHFVKSIKARLEFEVFIDNSYDADQIQAMQQSFSSFRGVAYVEYISKDRAADLLKQDFGTDIFAILEENPLPASFRIRVYEEYQYADSAAELAQRFLAADGIDDVIYRKDVLQLIDKYLNWFMLALLIGGLFVCLSALFFVYNTIRLIIFSRQDIIESMKLVGATAWFIRLPFIIEGLLQGLLGSLFALLLLYFVVNLVHRFIPQFFMVSFEIWFILFLNSLVIGVIGSTVAIRRFLKY